MEIFVENEWGQQGLYPTLDTKSISNNRDNNWIRRVIRCTNSNNNMFLVKRTNTADDDGNWLYDGNAHTDTHILINNNP